jgi:3D (Asp-Asp-Asp) domain-containing protein/peptidoglycan hydrolase CwlO-like protein
LTGAGPHKVGEVQRFVWYGPALVGRPRTRSAARLAGASAALVLAGVSAAGAARPGDSLRIQAQALDSRTHRALLDLYALDSRLDAARTRLSSLERQAAQLRNVQAELVLQLGVTRRTLTVSQQRLGDNLSMLYKQGDVSALAVMLGSESLDDAVTRLDDLNRVADQSREVVEVTAGAQARLTRLRAALGAKRAKLSAALTDARETTAALAAARAERLGFISKLRREQSLKVAQIHALEATVQRVVHKSAAIQAVAGSSEPGVPDVPLPAPAVPTVGGRTLTVSSTGYSLPGRTATGLPVGWGVVAVDPAVIPLGTRLTVPGYGEAVAADTGSGVRGNTIDLWFPTLAQARAWGRRAVTITLH